MLMNWWVWLHYKVARDWNSCPIVAEYKDNLLYVWDVYSGRRIENSILTSLVVICSVRNSLLPICLLSSHVVHAVTWMPIKTLKATNRSLKTCLRGSSSGGPFLTTQPWFGKKGNAQIFPSVIQAKQKSAPLETRTQYRRCYFASQKAPKGF